MRTESYESMMEEALSYGAIGGNAVIGLRYCQSSDKSWQGMGDMAARALGSVAGACLASKEQLGAPWTLGYGPEAPTAPTATRLGVRAISAAMSEMGATERQRVEALGELWVHCARGALMDCQPALRYKYHQGKTSFSWLADALLDEEMAQELAPSIAAAHLSALTGGAWVEGFARVGGWDAPLFRDERAWSFHMAALEWALEKSDKVELSPELLRQAMERRCEILLSEGDAEIEGPIKARMQRLAISLERAQISLASVAGAPSAARSSFRL